MHILIIRPGAIGDTLLTFPVIQALKAQYHNPHVTFVGNRAVLPLILAYGIADEVFDYQDVRWAKLFLDTKDKVVQDEVLQRSELAICWLRDPEGVVERNLLAAGVKRVVVAPGRPTDGERIHIVTYLARTIGLSWHEHTWHDYLPLQQRQTIEQSSEYSSTSLPSKQPDCIALHPGSGGAHKCWPVKHFAAVIQALWQHNVAVLLLAGPVEQERLTELLRLLPTPPNPNLLRTLVDAPLLDVAHQLQHSQRYLGNDSGLTHLAALLGMPTIALFGPSDPLIWQPIGPSVTVLYEPILENLRVETVLSILHASQV
ncbi:MAG TPA: glycosyltransferase family 9 protein [Ktedonobacteraceae bacterium]|jgi:ADP-heptose:LPS heptosyltransferase